MPNANAAPVTFVAGQIAQAVSSEAAQRFEAAAAISPKDPVEHQIVYLNRFWRRQLSALKIDTISEREALIDGCAYKEWQSLFIRHILPLAVRFQLPA